MNKMSNTIKKTKKIVGMPITVVHFFVSKLFFYHKLKPQQRKYFDLLIGAILVVLIPLAISLTIHPTKSEAAWFDDNWLYRQGITLTNTTTGTLAIMDYK